MHGGTDVEGWQKMRVGATRIASPKSVRTRPTTGLFKKVLFDTIGPLIQDAIFLDLFAGTGAVGLEALRRGAASVVFVENDRSVVRTLLANIRAAGAERSSRVVRADVISFLRKSYDPTQFDIIFAGPPYERGYLKMLVHILFCPERLPTRVLAIQTSKFELAEVKLPEAFPIRQKRVGDTVLLLLRNEA